MTTFIYCAITFLVTLIVAGPAAFLIGSAHRKKVAEAEIGSAEDQAKRSSTRHINRPKQRKKNC